MTRFLTLRPLTAVVAAAVVAALVVALTGCDEDDMERTLGHQAAVAVEQEYGVNTDPVLSDWVNVMGHRLVGQSHRQYIEYNFRVINTDMVNAFAAPWGYIYLTRGMMGFAKTEDEIAFVVGHEVGHVANRDAIKSAKKNLLYSLGAAILGSRNETLGEVGGLGAGLLLLHYSREDERDADVTGAMSAFGAGYDPAGGEAFFSRLAAEVEKSKPSRIEHLFLTHPETEKRIAALRTRSEMNLSDAATASHIGRGYARRYAFAKAAKYYNLALQAKPEAVTTRLALAQAYVGQGQSERARDEYQAVLQRDAGNPLATQALTALSDSATEPEPVALSEPERQAAAGLLGGLYNAAASEAASLLATYQTYVAGSAGKVAGASGVAAQSISSMLGIADMETELTKGAQKAFAQANTAISAANDAAFTLESVGGDMLRLRETISQVTSSAHQGLTEAAAGQGFAGDVGAYHRALVEAHHAAKTLGRAADAAGAAAELAKQATDAGSSTVSALSTMVRAKDQDRYLYPVKSSAESTLKQAKAAQEATRKVKKMTSMAEARAILAKLNLAALGTDMAVREAYDGMVAHYCSARPESVRRLREKGLGFGDAAFVLSAAQANRTDTAAYMNAVAGNELIEGLGNQGVSFEGPVLLLRFLANAIEEEAAARAAG